jgi:hypothetical protein
MSQENVEALRRLYEEWAKGNLWALRDIADPAIEWEWSDRMASLYGGPRTYRGFEEIGAATLEWLEPWDSYWMTAEGFIDAGDETVVVFMRLHARVPGTDSDGAAQHGGVDASRGEGCSCALLRRQVRRPRSRRALGIGPALRLGKRPVRRGSSWGKTQDNEPSRGLKKSRVAWEAERLPDLDTDRTSW